VEAPRRIRRTRYLFFYLHDGQFLDIEKFLRGAAELTSLRQLFAISMLRGDEQPIEIEELRLLSRIPADTWVAPSEVASDTAALDMLDEFARKGIVLCDDPGTPYREFRERDAALSSTAWNIYSALYHSMKRWHNMHLHLDEIADSGADEEISGSADVVERVLQEYGMPPHHFHSVDRGRGSRKLPLSTRQGALYDTLLRRRTARRFDADVPLAVDHLSSLL
jgi:hypothetical protein